MLELVVQFGKLAHVGIGVAGIRQSLFDQGQIRFWEELADLFRPYRARTGVFSAFKIRKRIIVQEEAEPRGSHHAQLRFQSGRRHCGVKTGFLHQSIQLLRQDGRFFFLCGLIRKRPGRSQAGDQLRFAQASGAADHLGLIEQRVFALRGGRCQKHKPSDVLDCEAR